MVAHEKPSELDCGSRCNRLSSSRVSEQRRVTTIQQFPLQTNHLYNTVYRRQYSKMCSRAFVLLTTEFLFVHLLPLRTKLCLIVYHCIGVTVIIGKKGMTFYIAVIEANCPSQCMITDQSIFTQPRTITWFRCVICPQPTPKVMCAICNSSVCVLDWKYQTKYFQSSKANDLELRV